MRPPARIVCVDSSSSGYDLNRPQVRIELEDGAIIIMDIGQKYEVNP